jgi:hypothetical protein
MNKNVTFVFCNHLTCTVNASSDSNVTGQLSDHNVLLQTYVHFFHRINQIGKTYLYVLQ